MTPSQLYDTAVIVIPLAAIIALSIYCGVAWGFALIDSWWKRTKERT